MSSREALIARAKIAEQVQRYDEMAALIKNAVEKNPVLNNDERNLLSVAYKHMAGTRRQSWRVLSSIEQKAEMENSERVDMVRAYREQIESEIEKICYELLQILDGYTLKAGPNVESQVFYNKMKGDYYRYMAEVMQVPEKRKKLVNQTNKAYNIAMTLATENMPAVHPIRLGLALNYSVFLYEIKNSEKKASTIAKQAFDEAINDVEMLRKHEYKDSTLIMQLICDNMKMWADTANTFKQL